MNNSSKKTKKRPVSRLLFVVMLLISTLLVGGVLGYKNLKDKTKPTEGGSPTSTGGINLNPPTEEDIKEAENRKEQLSNSSGNTTTPLNGNVTPIITSWGQANGKVEVAARVPGILEEGGLCTLTLKRGDVTRTGSSNAMANVSEVSCGFIAIPRSSLTAGEWSATVTYSSPKNSGTSEAKKIAVE